MSANADLRKRIEQLLADVGVRRETRWSEVRREMSRMEMRLERFDGLAQQWMDELVVPRFETLAALLPNSAPLVRTGAAYSAVLPFRRTDDLPVDARVEARIALGHGAECIRTTLEASIIPILMEYEREGTIECGLEAPDAVAVGAFLDERIVRFVQDYLRVREPESPYQEGPLRDGPGVWHEAAPGRRGRIAGASRACLLLLRPGVSGSFRGRTRSLRGRRGSPRLESVRADATLREGGHGSSWVAA